MPLRFVQIQKPVTLVYFYIYLLIDGASKRIDDLNALRKWLSILVAPGSSLGGARPKANFINDDGSLWIAKFPSKNDEIDIAAWEMVTHSLANNDGVNGFLSHQ